MKALQERPVTIPRNRACEVLGLSRTGTYRRQRSRRRNGLRAHQPRRLSDAQRQQILDLVTCERYQDSSVRVIYARELSAGRVWASVSTMYRILAEAGQSRERRAQRPRQRHAVPQVTAKGPNQAWSWDIVRHEALFNRVVVKDRHGSTVAAVEYKLRTARTGERRQGWEQS